MKTLIFGKKSYLSDYLKKSITNSKVYSLSEKNLDLAEFVNSNIIINSFYSSLKL
jgi:dTDP-4-dehydrorhamnose reductase